MTTVDSTKFSKKDLERLVEEKNPSVSFGKPKETPRMSKYWSRYSLIYVNKIKQDLIICDVCKSVLVYKSTTGSGCMFAHSRSCQILEKKNDLLNQQQKINHYYSSSPLGKRKVPKRVKDAITSACVEFVVKDGRPFHSVNGTGFVKLAKELFNSGKLMAASTIEIEDLIPDPTTISRNVDRMYAYYKEQLIKVCQSMDSFCLTVDFWTESYTGLSYCGLSISHIDLQYHSQAFLLGCYPYEMENKRAPTIRSFVDNILHNFGLKLTPERFVMSDNEATMKCTFNSNCKRVGCSDHYLNKQMQHTFVSKTVDGEDVNCALAQDMFDDVKNVVSSVRRMHKQQNLSKKLITYADTRFGGAYDMLVVFSNVFDELSDILDYKLSTIYSRIDRDFLFDVCEFLSPFVTVLDTLSDSKRPTLHRVLPLKQFLINKCNFTDKDKEGMKQVKFFLGKRLEEKWELSNEHLIATLIHPNLKNFHMCPRLRERAILLLKEEMFKRQDRLCTNTLITTDTNSSVMSASVPNHSIPSATTVPVPKSSSARTHLLMEIFDKQLAVLEINAAEHELEKYLTCTDVIQNDEDDILSYWKEHQTLFPLMASIARDILAIPASNTSVERLFSSCKNTITDKRTRLGGDKLNKIMFLQKNQEILKKKISNNFVEIIKHQDAKRKNDTIDSNDPLIQKKLKQHDHLTNYQNDDDDLVDFTNEDDQYTISLH